MTRIVDISSHQSGFNFRKAKSEGINGAIVKITGGIGYVNPEAERQIYGAIDSGMEYIGVYHYFVEPSLGRIGTGRQEAHHFLEQYNRYRQYNPTIWNDLEERRDSLDFHQDGWAQEVIYETSLEIGCYSGTYFWRENNLNIKRYSRLWLASWQDEMPGNQYHEQHDKISVWQFTSQATCGGMYPIDLNECMMSLDEWQKMGGKDVAPKTYDPWAYLKEPFGPHGNTVHPYFHGSYDFNRYGYPVGPAVLYTDGRIRQAFENGMGETNGRSEPRMGGASFAYALAAHQEMGKVIFDFADIHPMV